MDGLLNRPLFTLSGTQVTFATIVAFAVVLLVTMWASRIVRRALEHAFSLRGVRDPGTIGLAQRLSHYAVLFIGLAIALQTIGLNLGALFAAGAFFAVAVGFAMQNVAQNFVSGLLLLMERSIKNGDVLKVEGQVVRVTHIGLRSTVARTRDEEDLLIPNSILAQNAVLNYTLRDPLYRLKASVGVAYTSDLGAVMKALERAGAYFQGKVDRLQPLAILTGFGDSAVEFELHVWIDDPWRERRARSALYLAVWDALKDAGITIAYRQLDIHLDAPVVKSLETLRRAG
jgi:small-conductance mechanosensitive channel